MEKESKELIFINPKNQDKAIWINTQPDELQFNSSELPAIQKEINKLENEIKNFQTRIDQEIALTEKITENIKSRASNPKDVSVMKDVELQWKTTHANIENIKKMMLPRLDRIEELYKQLSTEKNNIIQTLRINYVNKLVSEINTFNEGLNYMKNVVENLSVITKTIAKIDSELQSTEVIEIRPNPIDSFEVFFESYSEYIKKLQKIIESQ